MSLSSTAVVAHLRPVRGHLRPTFRFAKGISPSPLEGWTMRVDKRRGPVRGEFIPTCISRRPLSRRSWGKWNFISTFSSARLLCLLLEFLLRETRLPRRGRLAALVVDVITLSRTRSRGIYTRGDVLATRSRKGTRW